MKLAFLCSSLEPGRDGVGDYTRRLAEECVRLGHRGALIALNDRHLSGGTEEGTDEAGLSTLRLPVRMRWKERTGRAAAFVAEFAPDWISLQFVGYGYHPKGIVAGLAGQLRRIIGSRRLHVMMHELWIGGAPQSSPKERLVGCVQRFFVLGLLKALRPSVVHTNLPVYVEVLAASGVQAGLLPLFGNIPIADSAGAGELSALVRGGGGPSLVGGFFGSFYPGWKAEPLLQILQNVAKKRALSLRLVSAGRLGAEGERWWAELSRLYSPAIQFVTLGEQPPQILSQIFQLLDFGIPTAPWHLLGKSSATASILDHGLPIVVAPDALWGFHGEVITSGDPSLIHRCGGQLESKLLAGLQKSPTRSSVAHVAKAFIECLSERSGEMHHWENGSAALERPSTDR